MGSILWNRSSFAPPRKLGGHLPCKTPRHLASTPSPSATVNFHSRGRAIPYNFCSLICNINQLKIHEKKKLRANRECKLYLNYSFSPILFEKSKFEIFRKNSNLQFFGNIQICNFLENPKLESFGQNKNF